ncbi:MAG: hypothetical protein ACREBI_04150 [Nitrosotalea sp.]
MRKKASAKRPKKSAGSNTDTKNDTRNKPGAKKSQSADPDSLALSKNDILQFCDRVLKKWQQNPAANARNIPAMIAVRTGVFFSDDVSLRAIWSEIISWVYQLLYENAQAQARHDNQEWARTFSKIKSDKV